MPLPAVQRHKFGRTDANTRAPVGADDSVRPAERTHEHGRTLANPYHICRGRCRALPARCTFVFMIRCGKFAIAPRADRGVRPYRTLCDFAENACSFVIARCRVDVGIDPYGQVALSPFGVRFCGCAVRTKKQARRGCGAPVSSYFPAELFLSRSYLICQSFLDRST